MHVASVLRFGKKNVLRKATVMALMRWGAFCEAYSRPFIVFADIDGGRAQVRFEILNSLVEGMGLQGAYALHPEPGMVRIVFENQADAQKFADAVQAQRTAREGGWAGQWGFALNAPAADTMRSLMPLKTRKSSGSRAGQRLNRRSMPF